MVLLSTLHTYLILFICLPENNEVQEELEEKRMELSA